MTNYQPEKLNIWDRFFNRYKTIPVEEGEEVWTRTRYEIWNYPKFEYARKYIKYHKIDRLTGSYMIFQKYLDKE
jgi:hypothetical protein